MENKKCQNYLAKKENGCKLRPMFDPDTYDFLGYLACEVVPSCPLKQDVFASAKKPQEQDPAPLQIDEVAHAYFNTYRVENWDILGEEFGGHKIGAIYSFALKLIEKHIKRTCI